MKVEDEEVNFGLFAANENNALSLKSNQYIYRLKIMENTPAVRHFKFSKFSGGHAPRPSWLKSLLMSFLYFVKISFSCLSMESVFLHPLCLVHEEKAKLFWHHCLLATL